MSPPPPEVPVPVKTSLGCPSGFGRVGPDRHGNVGCAIDWKKREGELGRTPAEGMHSSLINNHVVLDGDGMVRDVDNGIPCGEDAWGRKVCQGVLVPQIGLPWWDGEYAHPEDCPAAPPLPGPSGCSVVEDVIHHMAPGDRCHQAEWDGNMVDCMVDSTIRPICDKDHMPNWNGECGKRSHDPDYNSPLGIMDWRILFGALHTGFNHKNYAQAWIRGEQGAKVKVEVCIPEGKRTPDGCLITPRGGHGCDSREFTLPTKGEGGHE